MVAGHSWTWHFHFITMIELGWVILFTSHLTIGLSYHPYFGVNATNSSQCHRHVQEKSFSQEFTIQLISHPLQYLQPSFFSWPPFLNLVSSVCFHLQKSFSSFHVVDVGYIKALLQQVTSCRHQLIIQEVDLEEPFQCFEACIHKWKVSHF